MHCLVGDSGSGKTTTALAVVGLLPGGLRPTGEIRLHNDRTNLLDLSETEWANVRGIDIGYIGQNALGCLHPAYSVGFQLIEAIRRHQKLPRHEARDLAIRELAAVDLTEPEHIANCRPAQLSGGMCQRVALAIALCNRPQVLIADEPTTALDNDTQAHVLELISSRAVNDGLGVLLITHDLDVVDQIADTTTSIANGVTSPGILPRPAPSTARTPSPNHGEPVLEIVGVSKHFPRRRRLRHATTTAVLEDVTITAVEQTTIGVVGRSGAGKTTLAKIVAGVLAPTAGRVAIGGRSITGADAVDRTDRAGLVQYVFQDPYGSLNPRRTVVDQVADPLIINNVAHEEARSHARTMLSNVGLSTAEAERHPAALSGGQCQRVGLARALIRRPRVVILDEPVSALDWSIRNEILTLLDELQRELRATYLLISHEQPLVNAHCDEIYEIANGSVRPI